MSTRAGGVSVAPWDSLNLGLAVGDGAAAVAENRRRVWSSIGAQPVWLRQVHGDAVVRIGAADVATPAPVADAAWTDEPGVAAAVLVADCLPVLFATRNGRAVAAAHAGWRGLAAGVLERTVRALCRGAGVAPQELLAWLGPCIGPRSFEVGAEVLQAFGVSAGEVDPADPARFVARPRSDGSARWLANLHRLATDRLQRAGVEHISAAGDCTFEDRSRFFSFRRDGITGRHVCAIWLR